MLSGAMLNMNVKVDVRVADVGRGADPLHRILRYVMVPTPNKLQVDNSPCLTKGFEVPTFSLEEAAKSEKSLWNKAASADEVYQYLVELLKKATPLQKMGLFFRYLRHLSVAFPLVVFGWVGRFFYFRGVFSHFVVFFRWGIQRTCKNTH